VKAFDCTSSPEKGPIFEVPVTVVKPEIVEREISFMKRNFAPGDIQRHFIKVPKDATWAGIIIICMLFNLITSNCKFYFLLQFCLSVLKTKTFKIQMLSLLFKLFSCSLRLLGLAETTWNSTNKSILLNIEANPSYFQCRYSCIRSAL